MVVSQTPLRLSFVGGGTDFASFYRAHKGQVISATIDKYIYVIVKKRFDDLIVLHYTENEIVENVADIKHDIIKAALQHVGIQKGIEIITLADITAKGSGLGSSSVLTVGLLNALYHFQGLQVSSEQIAKEACTIEIEMLNKPIGKQDQYIAAYGGIKKIEFNPDESVQITSLPFSDSDKNKLQSAIILHNTSVMRKAESVLEEQSSNIAHKIQELKTIAGLVDQLETAFANKQFEVLGDLLAINWENKKKLASAVSNEHINQMVNVALANGATGCKIAGAGGGGFLMSYVPVQNQEAFRTAMSAYKELPYTFDPAGSRILLNVK
jgi:D-glycero-alpha-D-manno-heptose-7-phosphate kinase